MATPAPLRAFEGVGIEIEYMLVDRVSLAVAPLADRLIEAACGSIESELARGPLAWSNELCLHLIEVKTNGPAPRFAPLPALFQSEVAAIDALLADLDTRLMPTAMHPWMDPDREMRLWPHEYGAVYAAFDRIFDCRGHGWSNLQSTHVNLPFGDDAEFARLHAAIRVVLPLLPALAASSPFVGGRASGWLDTRLEFYRRNAQAVPAVTGLVVPEPSTSRAGYERDILRPMYADLAPHDPDGILQHEWLNARGAIARFDRHAIEIRVLDVQEHPAADLAIAQAASDAVRLLHEGRWSDTGIQNAVPTERLAGWLLQAARDGERAVVDDRAWLRALGFPERKGEMGEIWRHLVESGAAAGAGVEARAALATILDRGPLARRMLDALGPAPASQALHALARSLCDCLAAGRSFVDVG